MDGSKPVLKEKSFFISQKKNQKTKKPAWALLTLRTLGPVWWIDLKSVLKTIQVPSPSTAAYVFCLCASQQSLNSFYKTRSRDKTALLLQRSEGFHETTKWSLPRLTWPATSEAPWYRPVPLFSFTLLLHIHVVLVSQLLCHCTVRVFGWYGQLLRPIQRPLLTAIPKYMPLKRLTGWLWPATWVLSNHVCHV